jgi:penicillin-binding protein 1C
LKRKLKITLVTAGLVITPVMFSPLPVFKAPLSTVVEARDGTLLGARIADDGQWRFPVFDQMPEKFEKAILTFEDRYFYYHPGINPVSVIRAFKDNLKARRIVSGGSTLTMQVARLSGGNRPRTYSVKFIEILSAIKLEIFRSKKTILKMWAANAPFGGNCVGLEAAAWRYLGKSPEDLTWAEAATLAVLPNSPSLVFPGRNQETLKSRRDDLLRKLYKRKFLDNLTLELSLDEPLPGEPKNLPSKAPHLTDMFLIKNKGSRITTTIDPELQIRAVEIINDHQRELESNLIYNSACLIVSVGTGEVLAYVGNSTCENVASHGGDVDIIRSLRSTGSILKPLLYAVAQQSGDFLPYALIADIPTRFPGFSPKNFNKSYSGAVSAADALSQSLNIPAVKMLQKYNTEKFLTLLHKTGFSTFNKPADHYGLSIILGGGETSLWELTGVYASLSRVLKRYNEGSGYVQGDYHPPVLIHESITTVDEIEDKDPPLSAASIWLTYQALQKVNRPETEAGWQYFASSPNVAWKTGTSFGFRDAWAVGTTPDYVIGVWAGNADGEGRPGLTGISAAAPVLFDLISLMESRSWFSQPVEEMTMIRVCKNSGFRAGPDCTETAEIAACVNGLRSDVCPYHKIIHLDKSGAHQVTSKCISPSLIMNKAWFVLPPAMEYFYKQKHPEYKPLPPFAPGCTDERSIAVMEFIYPASGVKIFIPRDQSGLMTRVVAEVAHRNPVKRIFWHLDEHYMGTTKTIHQIEVLAGPGNHVLTVVDEDGNSVRSSFTITGRTNENY